MKKIFLVIICVTMAVFATSCEKTESGKKKCKCTIHEPGIDRSREYEISQNESCAQFEKTWWEDDFLCSIKCK